jgi:hypothetical protein
VPLALVLLAAAIKELEEDLVSVYSFLYEGQFAQISPPWSRNAMVRIANLTATKPRSYHYLRQLLSQKRGETSRLEILLGWRMTSLFPQM